VQSSTVRISEAKLQLLRELSAQTGESMQSILERALENYRRELLLEEANRAYEAMRNDPEAWREELEERELWERTLADGLTEQ
jgi:hypothetical protein